MKKPFLLFSLLLFSIIVVSQSKISGKVTDEAGEPLTGVSVVEKGENFNRLNGVITDLKGNYTLNCKQNQGIIAFNYIGMISTTKPFKGNGVVNVTMNSSDKGLDEVVVVAYGSQTKVSVVGAISTVNTKDLLQSPSSNLSNALAGRLTGLTTVQNTGQPGKDDASLYIRGVRNRSKRIP